LYKNDKTVKAAHGAAFTVSVAPAGGLSNLDMNDILAVDIL